MGIRTDMAVEAHELSRGEAKEIEGVKLTSYEHGAIKRTIVDVLDDNGAKTLNKMKGRYITIDAPDLKNSTDDYETVCEMLSDDLRTMCGNSKRTLVVGLGNREITPDALGSEVVDKLLITSHMKKYMPEVFGDDYGDVSAIAPGVMGTTGIETVDIVKGVMDAVKPETVIAIDALAGADINRVTTSIQIAATGIAPGSGVGNHRNGLNRDSLGVKVIAVGVPTVIAAELLGGGEIDEEFKSLMVTTNDIDSVIKRMSKTVANGINLALHRNMTLRELEELVE